MASQTPIPEAPDHTPATATSDTDGMLPSDTIREVLLHLPARSLCRLRAVCRSWRSLLSDPAFLAAHRARHTAPLVAAGVIIRSNHARAVEFAMLDMSGNIVKRVPGGWWCPQATLHTHHHLACIAVEDKCLRVRVVDLESGSVSFVPSRLHVEPRHGPRSSARCAALVLGRASSGEYKALRIRGSTFDYFCHVLNLGGDGSHAHWRETQAPPVTLISEVRNAVVANGIAYFSVYLPGHHPRFAPYHFDLPDSIASFDLATEQWSPTLLRGPQSSGATGGISEGSRLHLAEINDCLVMVHHNNYYGTMDLLFHVGSSSENGEALWCRRYAIQCESFMQMEPLWELDDGRVAVWVRGSGQNGKDVLRMCNKRDNSCVDVAEMENCVGVVGVYTGGMLSNY